MSTLKTRPHDGDVHTFLKSIENDVRRNDAFKLLAIFSKVTQEPPVMWGDSIVGFGEYRYTNSQGQQSWMLTGFSPRKQNLTLYIMQGFDNYQPELSQLGNVKTAKSCLYINRLDKIDVAALEALLIKTVADMRAKYAE